MAVFLGPSLPLEAAREFLDAQYFPPAEFGDVYRLVGSGVHTIVLIDGLFHGRAPVWQRELWYAIQSGIRVYGASSMGALRAAELVAHGMVGLGEIFQWYVTDQIDGDDEVALLHAGPEQGYRSLSMPLVNLRFNLREAITRGMLEPEHAEALIAAMKGLPFWERTLDVLWTTLAFRSLVAPRQAQLRASLEKDWIDLKQRDAVQALQEVARRRNEPNAARPSRLVSSYYDRFRLLNRRVPCGTSQRLDGQAVIERVFSDPPQRRLLQRSLAARFFVREWARERRIAVPAEELPALEAAWRDQVVASSLDDWLRRNGLTEGEYRDLLARYLLHEWLLGQAPEQFGLSSSLQDGELLPVFPDLGPLWRICERTRMARALPYVAAWCQWVGAAPGPDAMQALTARWGRALGALEKRYGAEFCETFLYAVWALEKGPIYFGYTTWSPATELLCELQITGTMSQLAAEWESATP
ncbi:MAG TPA: TfuA-like protein [Polyangia bacterium]|jgi:hypothetical protein|nr:TfuA-like protein [Polyangia bacterium]